MVLNVGGDTRSGVRGTSQISSQLRSLAACASFKLVATSVILKLVILFPAEPAKIPLQSPDPPEWRVLYTTTFEGMLAKS